jgi:hypothetical protein
MVNERSKMLVWGLSPKSFKTKKCGRKIKNQVWKKQNNISKGQRQT